MSARYLAATHNHLSVVQYLLHEANCSPHLTDNKGQNALHLAAKHGHIDVLKVLIDAVIKEKEI